MAGDDVFLIYLRGYPKWRSGAIIEQARASIGAFIHSRKVIV